MEQLVELIRWLRKLTKSVRRHKGIRHGQKNRLQLSNAGKNTLQLRFSEMGLSSATAPDAIMADKMEVETWSATTHRVQEEIRMFSGGVEECAEGLCGRGLSSEVEELLRNRKLRLGEGVDID